VLNIELNDEFFVPYGHCLFSRPPEAVLKQYAVQCAVCEELTLKIGVLHGRGLNPGSFNLEPCSLPAEVSLYTTNLCQSKELQIVSKNQIFMNRDRPVCKRK